MPETFEVLNGPNGNNVVIDCQFDGDHYTTVNGMCDNYGTAIVYLSFFNDAAGTDQVTPTGGTVTITGAPMFEAYITPTNGTGVINAADVKHGDATYTPPLFTGMIRTIKVVTQGITGARYMRALVWRK